MIYAVKVGGDWRVARKSTAAAYYPRGAEGIDPDRSVWSDDRTTGWLCYVGQEERYILLEAAEVEQVTETLRKATSMLVLSREILERLDKVIVEGPGITSSTIDQIEEVLGDLSDFIDGD
jgi:hypothetical protein